MLARFPRCLSFSIAATLALSSCNRDTPLQAPRADVIAQDTGGPPPSNDFRDSARFIPSVPYNDTTDVTNATVEAGEPTSVCHDTVGAPTRTVWYFYQSHAPDSEQLTAFLQGPAPGVLSVYLVDGVGNLVRWGCNSNNFGAVRLNADSGSAFYFQVSDSADASGPTIFVLLRDTIIPPPPGPPNDNFADARAVNVVPFSDTADFTNASREPFEPVTCAFQSKTIWYAFTSPATRAVSIGLQSPFFHNLSVYTGSSVGNLQFQGCGRSLAFTVQAGVTYFIQVGGDFDERAIFFINPPPPPQANFFSQPFDPSTFDLVQFFDQSFDPVGVGFQPPQWSFGDGASATGFVTTHRYAADGDYRVELRVTTIDGRTASASRTLQVRTHDIAITRFQTPTSGMSGKTTKISIGIRSNRYPETVNVQLFKSVPGGYQLVATSTQTLPTRNRVSSVIFSYIFTPDDAVIGKVTFRAVATILGARDALPADNEAIGAPTKVRR
jgi:PKD repeat protein